MRLNQKAIFKILIKETDKNSPNYLLLKEIQQKTIPLLSFKSIEKFKNYNSNNPSNDEIIKYKALCLRPLNPMPLIEDISIEIQDKKYRIENYNYISGTKFIEYVLIEGSNLG